MMLNTNCPFILKLDANSGEPDLSVDEQRNRIVTANAINQGQALADKGINLTPNVHPLKFFTHVYEN